MGKEFALHLQQVGERDAAALLGGRDHEISERGIAIGLGATVLFVSRLACRGVGDVVNEQSFMGISQFLGFVVGDLGEDDRRDG